MATIEDVRALGIGIHADLAALDPTEARELVSTRGGWWSPQKLSHAYDLAHPHGPG